MRQRIPRNTTRRADGKLAPRKGSDTRKQAQRSAVAKKAAPVRRVSRGKV